ncbi:MAG: tRNA (N6-isopentenyl adenosine(37)-C2)-methylthiotransferase MiaB [Oscillospiraceae bacterium]|jgi:tRNA-2-methylthio-N6-dimethylallyladenosine synthase|nr:tRNA (N6-isopentenyl adenosine(37)-C2)-methylthiotransferase MiaB [Oscillospiraceae bacterium]
MSNAAEKLKTLFADNPPRAFVGTYGCQQNEADSEKLRGMLYACGCVRSDDPDECDVAVINTCAVRAHAETKVYGVIGAFVPRKKRNPNLIVAVCGCMVQRPEEAEKLRESHKHVDLVFGTHVLHELPELLLRVVETRARVFETPQSDGVIVEDLPHARDGKYKAWLSVMYGCDNFCSYCIVPYVRGRERSREPERVLAEARELIASGVRDITLLGQNVNSYGRKSGSGYDFPRLLTELSQIPGDYLLRFMTSHPKDAGDALFRAMAESGRVARHLHLPFQSGSTRVLGKMNRGYSREQYLSLITKVRGYMPDIALTSDVIVGFPGEELSDFNDTMSLIEEVRFDALFTFIYSPRPGAPSALTVNNTPKDEIQRRFDLLAETQNRISGERHGGYAEKTVRVLVDGDGGPAEYPYTARTSGNRLVKLKHGTVGEFLDVTITGANRWSLTSDG